MDEVILRFSERAFIYLDEHAHQEYTLLYKYFNMPSFAITLRCIYCEPITDDA